MQRNKSFALIGYILGGSTIAEMCLKSTRYIWKFWADNPSVGDILSGPDWSIIERK